jgi:hypothetical protein
MAAAASSGEKVTTEGSEDTCDGSLSGVTGSFTTAHPAQPQEAYKVAGVSNKAGSA